MRHFSLSRLASIAIVGTLFLPLATVVVGPRLAVTGGFALFGVCTAILLAHTYAYRREDLGALLSHPLVLSLFGIGIAGMITLPFTVHPVEQVFGEQTRLLGPIFFLLCGAWLVSALPLFTSTNLRSRLATAAAISGVFQLIGEVVGSILVPHVRPGGLVGNPAFLASVFLVLLGLILADAFSNTCSRRRRIVLLSIAALCTAGLLWTRTQGALLGLGIGSMAALSTLVVRDQVRRAWIAASIFVLGAIAATCVAVFFTHGGTHLPSWLASSAKDRLAVWNISLHAIQERPWAGYGTNGFSDVFDRFVTTEFQHNLVPERWYDRPHNTLLDITVSFGVFGLLAICAFWITAIAYAYRSREFYGSRTGAVFVGTLVAFFTADLFLFPTPWSWGMLLPVLALIITPFLPSLRPTSLARPLRHVVHAVLAIVILCLGCLPLLFTSMGWNHLQRVLKQDVRAYTSAESTLTDPLFGWFFLEQISSALRIVESQSRVMPAHVQMAIRLCDTASQQRLVYTPDSYQALIIATHCARLRALHLQDDPSALARAQNAVTRAGIIAPYRAETQEELGELYLVTGKPTMAVDAFSHAITYGPPWSDRAHVLYLRLTQALIASGAYSDALTLYASILVDGYPSSSDLRPLFALDDADLPPAMIKPLLPLLITFAQSSPQLTDVQTTVAHLLLKQENTPR